MSLTCQSTQWYLLLAIRAELVKELKRMGVKQTEIARLMGMTPAAVSQYVKGKRGTAMEFDARVKERINTSARRIAGSGVSGDDLFREICELGIFAKKSGAEAMPLPPSSM